MKEIKDRSRLLDYLSHFDIHSIFSAEVMEKLTLHRFQKGDILCKKGDILHSLYFLVKGKVKIYTTTLEGKTFIVRFKTPLAVIGDVEYVNGMEALNTVEAVTEGIIITVRYSDLRLMETNRMELLQFLLNVITHKLYSESQATNFNMLLPVEARLASYLLTLSPEGCETMFYKEMKTSKLVEVASLLGTSYRHLNRVIHKLSLQGVIQRNKGSLYILDLSRLRELANGNIYE